MTSDLFSEGGDRLMKKEMSGRIYGLIGRGWFMVRDRGVGGFMEGREGKEEGRLGWRVRGGVIGVKEDGSVKNVRFGEEGEGG
ncbi:hypothetical protein [Bacillus pumilus]|uniref:hypothetical protein n=1 Tax=Bacillus pumilus TaxID=1408 RepID=UPI0034D956A8